MNFLFLFHSEFFRDVSRLSERSLEARTLDNLNSKIQFSESSTL